MKLRIFSFPVSLPARRGAAPCSIFEPSLLSHAIMRRALVTHWAESTLKFSSNNRRTQDSASTISSAAARGAYSQTAVRFALLS